MVWSFIRASGDTAQILESGPNGWGDRVAEFRRVLLPLGMEGSSPPVFCVSCWREKRGILVAQPERGQGRHPGCADRFVLESEGLFWAKLSCASFMAIAPIVVFGWFCQRQLVQGLTFGAVKIKQ